MKVREKCKNQTGKCKVQKQLEKEKNEGKNLIRNGPFMLTKKKKQEERKEIMTT